MSIETIIARFGYLALITGLLFEGETVLVLGAFMARRGYLSLPVVILIGFVVTFASDQFFFWIGRTRGSQFLEKRPSWQPAVQRAKFYLDRSSNVLFFGFRFMYGLRTVLPFVFGMERLSAKRFVFLNLIATLMWALVFGIAGYEFGRVMEGVVKDVGKYELWIACGIVALGAGLWFLRRWVRNGQGEDESGERPSKD